MRTENQQNIGRQTFFSNRQDRIFTVRLAWDISQPFVCGTLPEVIKYALQPNNGIEGFFEITGTKMVRVSKKELEKLLNCEERQDLGVELFKKY